MVVVPLRPFSLSLSNDVQIWTNYVYGYLYKEFIIFCYSYIIVLFPCPLEASCNCYSNSPNSFIYSFKDKEGLAPFKSIVNDPPHAIYSNTDKGPAFGLGHDFYISNNANSNQNSHTHWKNSRYYSLPNGIVESDSNLAGTYSFTPDDYEVFYVNGS